MNKKILAVAVSGALASMATGASFAQTSVSIIGNLDVAAATIGGSQTGAHGTTISTTVGTASTTSLQFDVREDIGRGLKAQAFLEIDPRTWFNDGMSLSNAVVASSTSHNFLTGLTAGQRFLGLEGAFGTVKLGSPNAIGVGAVGVSSVLGTGIGSGYGTHNANAIMNSVVQTRYNRSIRWDSRNVSGITVSALYAPGSDEVQLATTTARIIPNARTATEFGITYAQGPLTVAHAYVAQGSQTNATGFYSGTQVQAQKTSANTINVKYQLGNTTLAAGINEGDRLAADTTGVAVRSNGSRIAVGQQMGAFFVGVMSTQQSAKPATGEVKNKVTGLRVDYALSKRTTAYAGYQKWDSGVANNTATTTGGHQTISSVGLRHSW